MCVYSVFIILCSRGFGPDPPSKSLDFARQALFAKTFCDAVYPPQELPAAKTKSNERDAKYSLVDERACGQKCGRGDVSPGLSNFHDLSVCVCVRACVVCVCVVSEQV